MSRRARNNKGDSLRLMIQHGNRSTGSQGEHADPPQPQRTGGRLIFVPLNKSNNENIENPDENEENIDVNDTPPPTQPRQEQNINIINNNNNNTNNEDNDDNDRLPNDRRFFPRDNELLNTQTNILDIHPKDWGGILCANAQPFDFIPQGLESIIRKVFAQYGIRLVE